MKILVSGPRTGYAQEQIDRVLGEYLQHCRSIGADLVVIEGCADGVDTQAFLWAKEHAVPVLHYPAPWNHLPRWQAGPWRNRMMLRAFSPDLVICFHPDIATGRGTRDMALAAARAGFSVRLVGSTMPLPQKGTPRDH